VSRYLTDEQKCREISHFARMRADKRPPGDLHGRGWPDAAIVPWCDRINALEGVVTLQSCAGHAGDSTYPGNIWVCFAERPARVAYLAAPVLAACPLIERVRCFWHPNGEEVWEILFHGSERGQFEPSIKQIFAWVVECCTATLVQQ